MNENVDIYEIACDLIRHNGDRSPGLAENFVQESLARGDDRDAASWAAVLVAIRHILAIG